MSYNYVTGDGLAVLDATKPDGAAEPVSILDDAIRQIKAYLLDDSYRSKFCAVSNVDQNVVGNDPGGGTKLVFGVEQFQVGTCYNTATGTFTAVYAGYYLVVCSVRIDTQASSSPTGIADDLSINVNGVLKHRFDQSFGDDTAGICRQIVKILKLSAGDTVELYLTCSMSGGTITRKVTGDPDKTSLAITMIP